MAKYVEKHKPIIETIINTSALALTTFGVMCITTNNQALQGYLALGCGMALEYFKYTGRKKQLW